MSKLRYSYIEKGNKIVVKPNDVLVSLGDIIWCGYLFSGRRDSAEMFAAHLIALSHLVTRIVLSDRLVFAGPVDIERKDNDKKDALYGFCETMGKNCKALIIDVQHEIVNDSWPHGELTDLYPSLMIKEYRAAVKDYSPWIDEKEEGHVRGWLTELNMAQGIGIPFAPNPAISTPLGLHWARTYGTSEYLVRYLEDIRRENAEQAPEVFRAMNSYDLQIPAIFSAVLRESNSQTDIFRVAAQMQNEATSFRAWCRDLDSVNDPKIYADKLGAAQHSLDILGRTLNTKDRERMLVPITTPGLSPTLPIPSLKKWIDWLNVDLNFVRPRGFLLNLLSSARQVSKLDKEITSIFDVKNEFSSKASQRILTIARSQSQ